MWTGLLMVLAGGGVLGNGVTSAPLRVELEGLPVPPSAVRFVAGRTLLSCQWLQQNAAGLNCWDARPNHLDQVVVQVVERPADGVKSVTFAPKSTTRRTYRQFNWRDPQPLPARAQFGKDVFVPVQALAQGLGVPVNVVGKTVQLGRAQGFAALMHDLQKGSLWQAREATKWLKTRSEVNLPVPSGQASETNDALRLWPQGEVGRQFAWYADIVTYAEVQGGFMVTRWAAKLEGHFMHERRSNLQTNPSGADTLERYLGVPLAQQIGQRPLWQGPLTFEAGHIFGIATTEYWGTVTSAGQEITRQEAYYQYGDRLVRGPNGVLQKTTEPLPDPYADEARND